jgi:hypothetical protein
VARVSSSPASSILNPKATDNGSIGRWTAVPNGGISEPSSIDVPAAVAGSTPSGSVQDGRQEAESEQAANKFLTWTDDR